MEGLDAVEGEEDADEDSGVEVSWNSDSMGGGSGETHIIIR